jgi:hypothetical protein
MAAVVFFGAKADARGRIIDGGQVSACQATQPTSSAATTIALGVSTNFDCTLNQTFSININGATYSSVVVNENGIVSFGAAVNADPATTALSSLSVPAFAPFFADGAFAASDPEGLKYGYTTPQVGFSNSFWLTWNNWLPQGSTTATPNIFQMGIVDLGGGDFDLIFNYERIDWDGGAFGAQAGLTLGTGVAGTLLLSGAGISSAYFGFDDTSSGSSQCQSATPATALACNQRNDGSQAIGGTDASTGQPANGYYLFKFRDGQLVNSVNEVPLPAAAWLFLAGFTLVARRSLVRR